VDLVVTQNGNATKLYRNVRGKPDLRVHLEGPSGNPVGVGAVLRLLEDGRRGLARELHAGSGYWSQDSAVMVLGSAGPPSGLLVRWPGGVVSQVQLSPGTAEVVMRAPTTNQQRGHP
jgi:enediyne biosynthesis protein E4